MTVQAPETPVKAFAGLSAPIFAQSPENGQEGRLQALQSGSGPSSQPISFVHGLFGNGELSVDLLRNRLAILDHETREFDWGPAGPLKARLRQKRLGSELLAETQDGQHAVAHSFGCNLMLEAMRQGRRFDQVWFFAPALPVAIDFPDGAFRKLYIIHHPQDSVLKQAHRWLSWLGFGEMGRTGYLGDHPLVENMRGLTPSLIHGDYFQNTNLDAWAREIHHTLQTFPPYPTKEIL